MANSVDMYLNINNSLNRDFKKTLKYADSFNDKLFRSEFATKRLSKGFSGIGQTLNKISRTARDLVPAVGVIFGGGLVLQSTRNVIKYSQSFRELAHQMGDNVSSTGEFSKAMVDASLATGLATEDIGDLIIGLRGLRVPLKNMEEAAIITARFSEVTGVGADSSARLFGEMMRVGRMSQKMATQTMASMASIQKEFGLTNSELENISYEIITITQSMNLLGKSSTQAKNMASGAVAMAIAFSKAGLEADNALNIINDLLNPESVQENAFLYAKLGISIGDAFEGNVDVVGKMIPKMSELGKQMQNMSGPAAAAMAKSLGMPLNTLRQFGEINLGFEDQKELARLMGEEGLSAGEALANMQSKTRGLDKVMNAIANTIQSVISKGAEILGKHFEGIGESLRSFDDSDSFKRISETMENAASHLANFVSNSGGLEGIFEKITYGLGKITSFIMNAPKMIPLIGVGLFIIFKKVRKKLYSATTGAVKDMTNELKIAVDGVYSMMEERSNSIKLGKVSPRKEMDRPGALSVEAISRRNKARTQENILEVSFIERQLKLYKEKGEAVEEERKQIQKRYNYLLESYRAGEISYRQANEMNVLAGIIEIKREKALNIASQVSRIEARAGVERDRQLKKATIPSLEALYLEVKQRKENLKIDRDQVGKNISAKRKELENTKKLISLMEKEASIAITSGRGEDASRILEKIREQEYIQTRLNKSLEENKFQHAEISKELSKQEDMHTKIEETYKKRTGRELDPNAPAEMKVHGIIARLLETTGQVYGNMMIGIGRAAGTVKDSFNFIVDSTKSTVRGFLISMRDRPVQMLYAGAKKTISGTSKVIGKVMNSSIGRLIGPMAILGVAMKLLQPLLTALKPALDELTSIFQNVLIKILKAIGPPILNVLAALMPLMASLVNVALPPLVIVLGYLLKALNILTQGISYLLIGISKLPFMDNKLDSAIKAMSEISESFLEGSENTIEAGKEMWANKVLDAPAVKSLQKTLTNVADRFASGDIVLTTKEKDTADKFGGAGISLDSQGRVRITDPVSKPEPVIDPNLIVGNHLKRSEGVPYSPALGGKEKKPDFNALKVPLGVAQNFANMGIGVLNGLVSATSSLLLPMMEEPKKIGKADFISWIDNYETQETIKPKGKNPEALTTYVTRTNAMELYQNKLVLETLKEIAEGIENISAHEQESVENLKSIVTSSHKTASQVGRSSRASFAEMRK